MTGLVDPRVPTLELWAARVWLSHDGGSSWTRHDLPPLVDPEPLPGGRQYAYTTEIAWTNDAVLVAGTFTNEYTFTQQDGALTNETYYPFLATSRDAGSTWDLETGAAGTMLALWVAPDESTWLVQTTDRGVAAKLLVRPVGEAWGPPQELGPCVVASRPVLLGDRAHLLCFDWTDGLSHLVFDLPNGVLLAKESLDGLVRNDGFRYPLHLIEAPGGGLLAAVSNAHAFDAGHDTRAALWHGTGWDDVDVAPPEADWWDDGLPGLAFDGQGCLHLLRQFGKNGPETPLGYPTWTTRTSLQTICPDAPPVETVLGDAEYAMTTPTGSLPAPGDSIDGFSQNALAFRGRQGAFVVDPGSGLEFGLLRAT